MCGLTGFIDRRADQSADELTHLVGTMAATLRHRGPDDAGTWVDAASGLALGHRRLSILDLSAEGHQPMVSASGRWVLAYNGEIYNHRVLRARLESAGHRFRGHSDTEVLLAAIEAWGVERALRESNGMFALAAWDGAERALHLARDRMGEKPLYYGWMGQVFLFGSELKALRAHPSFSAEVDRDALCLYLRHNCVPAPWSIYRGIAKLPAANRLVVRDGRVGGPWPYWSVAAAVEAGRRQPLNMDDGEAADRLEAVLAESVLSRMESDVPLGAFLSGGVDSSTVVALMQSQSARPVRTFTIGFAESAYDESVDARAVAAHLGTEHTELRVDPAEARSVIPALPDLYDEPFADSSQIPTHLVSALARRSVTVALSGDGGDELFAGYNRYVWAPPIWARIRRAPRPLRRAAAVAALAVAPSAWDRAFEWAAPVLPARARVRTPGYKVHKLADVLPATGVGGIHHQLTSHWKDPESLVLGGHEPPSLLTRADARIAGLDPAEQMMQLDALTYLPDDILTKVDRASMGVSLEARVPLLDHRVVELAWSIPLGMKLRHGEGKWLLRQVLYRHVPPALIDRPKAGFGIPIDSWLRGPLEGWVESLIGEDRLRREGFLRPEPIRRLWSEHRSGRRDWQYHLWDVLMFQAWLDRAGPVS